MKSKTIANLCICESFSDVRVVGLVETFLSVSGPFLPDVPGFPVPPDSVFPMQL